MALDFTLLDGTTALPEARVERYRELGLYHGLPLDSIVRRGQLHFGSRTAVVAGKHTVTYAELDKRVDEKAAGFLERGLRPLDRVVLQLPNVYEFVECFFALVRLGAIPILALPGHRQAELSYFIRHTDAVMYVAPDTERGFDFRTLGDKLLQSYPSLQHVVIVGEPQNHLAYSAVWAGARTLPSPDPRQVALLQLSGGSTGTPKLIPRTHEDYLCSVAESVPLVGLTQESRYLVALPAAHNFTLSSAGILGALWCGAAVVMARAPNPDVAFPLLTEERITHTALVPSLARAWLDAAEARKLQFPALDVMQVGGARLEDSLAHALVNRLGVRLQQVYGMAEGLVNYTRLDDSPEQIASTQGRPMCSEDEVRIIDAEGHEVATGEVGQLLVRGPYTIAGYYRAPEHNLVAFSDDGFYRTGDLMRLSPQGNFIVVGRVKDQINRGGEKLAPVELEEHLLVHPSVLEAAVVGQADKFLGERIAAFIALKPGMPALTQGDVVRFLRSRGLATFKVPDRVVFLDSLPRTSVGKMDKAAMKRHVP